MVKHAIRIAKREAGKSQYPYRHGAVVLNKKKIKGKGYNSLKTYPNLCKLGYHSTHAECQAIMHAGNGDTLVVVRINKKGQLTCSKPCEKCLTFMKEHGIKRIVFSDWDSSIKEMKI